MVRPSILDAIETKSAARDRGESMSTALEEKIARARRAASALAVPDASLARVPNTIRQSIREVIEDLIAEIERNN